MITFGDLERHALHALHSEPDGVSMREIINTAARAVTNAHSWEYLDGASVNLTMEAEAVRVALPPDFRSDAKVVLSSTIFQQTRRVTDAELQAVREATIIQYANHLLLWSVSSQPDEDGVPRPYLEYFPRRSEETVDAINVVYTRDWAEMTQDNQVAAIPAFMEPLLIQAVRAVALGWEDDEVADVDQRLSLVLSSRLFEDARRRDGEGQLVLDPPPLSRGGIPNWEQGYRYGEYGGIV